DKTKMTDSRAAAGMSGLGERNIAYLVVVAGGNLGEMHRVDSPETVIGRGAQAQIRIIDENISRQHARLFRAGDSLFIEDLKSANGTWVNGDRITKRVLNDGDKVSVG